MASNEFDGTIVTFEAAEAITKYRFVDLAGTTAKEAAKCSIADSGDKCIGIATETIASGGMVPVAINGRGRLEVDGGTAIAGNDRLRAHTDSAGRGLLIGGGTANQEYGAIALEPSTVAGDIIRVLILSGASLNAGVT
jgi:hypothetical protein